jgi:hypothetical protein
MHGPVARPGRTDEAVASRAKQSLPLSVFRQRGLIRRDNIELQAKQKNQ